ncbi:hypothetical protein FHS96_003137 [Sphingomonas zeicaulis]|uniref:AcrB/AcrD/AcrF family protein n=1 Tax=Sphingomonas zeicaulis TaxID=1632740 RepID=UPI003D1FDE43
MIDKADAVITWLGRHWRLGVLLVWALTAIWMVNERWNSIHWLVLNDTDDNMRLVQVRAWLHGQGWFDLRQYKLNPPGGFDIHWSRLVDLPIAGLYLLFQPFVGAVWAERWAAGLAPLLPMGVAMAAAALTVRRLINPRAFFLGAVLLLFGQSALMMFMPMRIDHHGWQLALLMVTVAGLSDPDRTRGGATVGIGTALSMVIGLELFLYLAVAGATVALRWVWDGEERQRMQAYALTLAGGTAAGYLVFTSEANRVARCDALTPVWLSTMLVAGALLFLLSRLRIESRAGRLALAVAAGGVLAGAFALAWPTCLGRPEQVSPELEKLWLANVREAKPLYSHPMRTILPVIALPVAGIIGTLWAAWRSRGTPAFGTWLPMVVLTLFSSLMLLWQTRAGPSAQLLAIPGAAAIGWTFVPWAAMHRSLAVRFIGTGAALLVLILALATPWITRNLPATVAPISEYRKTVNRANGRCPQLRSLAPIGRMPAATVMTFVDLGPRLIAVTHHKAIAGPYHRNGDAILDIHHAFDGTPENARATAIRHGATLLLVCPNMSESTIYRSRSPKGFYARLSRDEKFDWLEPVPLPADSPYRLWRIR